jgi:hypothetical protein
MASSLTSNGEFDASIPMEYSEEERALRNTLEHEARDIRLSLRHGDHPGFFHLTKKNPLSEEECRVSADWPLVELGEVIAKRAEAPGTVTPTCWQAKVMENSGATYEPDEHWVTVEVLETDVHAPAWAQYEANRYISTSHPGANVTYDANTPPSEVSPPRTKTRWSNILRLSNLARREP